MIICFDHNFSYTYYLLLHIYALDVFFKQAFHANPGADKKRAGSSSYISMHLFLKFSNTSASNNVALGTYIS